MKNFLLLILLFSALTSCVEDANESGDFAYFGGEIVNPNTNFVVLSRGEDVIDTLLLDDSNRFMYKFEDLNPGLYLFNHQPESQIVFLESGDSIHLRLNTLEFDESLVFTGKGAKKNNYLINLYLENEEERGMMLELCQLDPMAFDKKIDSTTKVKHEKLKAFERKNSTSELFNEIADANIHYHYYANKEIYPFAYYGDSELKNLKSLPKDFYTYRKDVNYNNDNLRSYFPYYRFLNSHFNNLALNRHFEHSNDSVFVRHALDYNLDRLAIIDSLVSNPYIKNMHLKHTATRFIYRNKSAEDIRQLVTDYLKLSTNEKHKSEIENVAESFIKLSRGSKIPNIELIDGEGNLIGFQSIIKKPTVVFFWSANRRSQLRESHLKAKRFKETYPELEFIAINANETSPKKWKYTLKQYGFPMHNEYLFKDPKQGRKDLVVSSMSKVMLVDAKGRVVDPHANMASVYFEEALLGLLNQ